MPQLVNVGCGHRTHPAWINLDLTACNDDVTECDLRRGLAFESDSCDAIYHSHVLEHLPKTEGARLLNDCFRVLKPGGVIRVVVPDLEQIAKNYLAALTEAESDTGALLKVDWMKLEMLDQVGRTRSGGEMLPFVRGQGRECETFIRSRLGDEIFGGGSPRQKRRTWRTLARKLTRTVQKLRRLLALGAVMLLEGRSGGEAFREATFRQSGELHRWMYDRLSLKVALESAGFTEVVVCTADQSRIPNFASYELDTVAAKVRKPDSLFMEGIKPAAKSDAGGANRIKAA